MTIPRKEFHPAVQELVNLIAENHWRQDFETAIRKAHSKNVPLLRDVTCLAQFLDWINRLLYWIPAENSPGKNVYDHLCAFYFVFDQEPVRPLQNQITPREAARPQTRLSRWLVTYARAQGEFLDTPGSFTPESEKTFYDSPAYNLREYLRPRQGWQSFNQFFARLPKPGYRPIAAIADPTVIVSPADSTFAGQWEIRPDSQVTVKGLHWPISELLAGSPHRDRFVNGLFMHAFLSPTDYHRQHAPVGGRVLEARVIPGQVYLEVVAVPDGAGGHALKPQRTLAVQDNAGYQFAQARGLIVLETPIGLVAVLPIGMGQVSSVVITAEVGITLRKGEELSYFQFGGSDVIVLFEGAANVSLTAQPAVHYKMGARIAQACP